MCADMQDLGFLNSDQREKESCLRLEQSENRKDVNAKNQPGYFMHKLLCTQNGGGSTTSEKPFTGTTDFAMLKPGHVEKSDDK